MEAAPGLPFPLDEAQPRPIQHFCNLKGLKEQCFRQQAYRQTLALGIMFALPFDSFNVPE